MYRLVFIILLTGCFYSARCQGQQSPVSAFEASINEIMDEYEAIGVSVVLVKENKISFTKSFGYKPNYEMPAARDSIRKDDISWIASISKTFVATAIMQLVESGLVSLDDDVNKYLNFKVTNPYYPDTPITIRMLLCHISSLNGKMLINDFDQLSADLNKDYRKYYLEKKPGSIYSYCNTGYLVLSAIIEKAAGVRFDEFIDQHIMKPLNLYGGFDVTRLDSSRFIKTRYYNKKTKKFINVKSTYIYDKNKIDHYVLGKSTPCLYAPGGMKISVTDLAKFMLMHMNNGLYNGARLISDESEKEMRKVQNGKSYGLALAHYNNILQGKELIGMTGGSRGIHSVMFFHPEEKYGFIVVCYGCTSTSTNGIQMNREIVREMYNHFIK